MDFGFIEQTKPSVDGAGAWGISKGYTPLYTYNERTRCDMTNTFFCQQCGLDKPIQQESEYEPDISVRTVRERTISLNVPLINSVIVNIGVAH